MRFRLSRSAMTVAVLMGLVGSTAGIAVAAPTPNVANTSSTRASVTDQDKIRAAVAVGYREGELQDLLLHTERGFVVELWKRAMGKEVRAAIELALQADTSAEYTRLVLTGVHEAKKRDDDNMIREDAQAAAERELKRRAAAAIQVIATSDMLALSVKDFTFKLWDIAKGAEVKKTAMAAFKGSAEDQRKFLESGVRLAFEIDQETARREAEHLTEVEKEKQRIRDTKKNAAAAIGIVSHAEMVELTDDNFIREIRRKAEESSWIALEAGTALNNPDPKVWRAFIETGIYVAKQKDRDHEQATLDKTNRDKILAMQARAQNSGMNPELAKAAEVALRGSVEDRKLFLKTGWLDVLRQSLQVTTPGLPGSLFARHEFGFGTISPVDGNSPALAKEDATWIVRPGLADRFCYSLESVNVPGRYLRHQEHRVKIDANDESDVFAKDATWCARKGRAGDGVSLESFNMTGRFIRHIDGGIWLANNSGQHSFDNPHMFDQDVTWRVTAPWATQPK
ncbi:MULTISPECIES: AbfB domain-containing protein [unclassified Crossiella]|uniref:AbfB domain-containing protein n=1 Tax=unclassified Crossiella TaxID=2620835 RepID=UPI001FFEA187|nr:MULTISPECIES: AbfB domain-containing protein [unclassified Crossiella]MCK2240694.1 AbfB domain-containing protein [Crossiella sp. S99.2]MCK2252855.1 AbfB domain-containing protein [Crossiella sp. S99.1]